jgi:hypothetical protein
MRVISLFLVGLLAATTAAAQTVASPAPVTPAAPAAVAQAASQDAGKQAETRGTLRGQLPLPVDIPRIEREVQREPALKLDEDKIRFYVLILGKRPPTWEEIVGDYDLMNGPTRAHGGAAMTHKEFLEMVTPKELQELFGGTNANSLAVAQAAIMNAVGQSLVKKAVQALRSASSDNEVRAIRQQIDRELRALEGRSQ